MKEFLEKENYNLIEEQHFFEELQVDGGWYFKVGVGLYGVWLGQKNLCCNWVEFSMELGINSPTSYSILNFVICFGRLGCTVVNYFLSKKTEKELNLALGVSNFIYVYN